MAKLSKRTLLTIGGISIIIIVLTSLRNTYHLPSAQGIRLDSFYRDLGFQRLVQNSDQGQDEQKTFTDNTLEDTRLKYNISVSREKSSLKSKENELVVNKSKSDYASGNQTLYLTVRCQGRTGNVMFQYAALIGLAHRNGRVPFVNHALKPLDNVFRLTKIEDRETDGWPVYSPERYGIFEEQFYHLPKENIIMGGYFQSWKYFLGAEHLVRKEFVFQDHIKAAASQIVDAVRKDHPHKVLVGVHQRLGDFQYSHQKVRGYKSAPASYLYKAFDHFRQNVTNVHFLVVSDDIRWCERNLQFEDVTFARRANGNVHLAVLSMTDHVIFSSGTFGWWGAWLAGGKAVYYTGFPAEGSEIADGMNKEDYYPPKWIGLGD